MCKQIILIAAVALLALYLLKSKEGFQAEPQPEDSIKSAVIGVPITDTLCMDYQLVHSTPGMAEYCRNLGTLTNWM